MTTEACPKEILQQPRHASHAVVAVLSTTPESVLDDYERLLEMAKVSDSLDTGQDTLLKLNLSWTEVLSGLLF